MNTYGVVAMENVSSLYLLYRDKLKYEESLQLFYELVESNQYKYVTLWADDYNRDRPITIYARYK